MPRRKVIDLDLIKIGERIRGIRKQVGLSLGALAHRTDINKGHISNIEAGRVSLTLLLAIRLAEGLEVSIADLVPEVLQTGTRPSRPQHDATNDSETDLPVTSDLWKAEEARCAA